MTLLTLPWPDKRLSPNARQHWAVKSPVTRGARHTACYSAKAVGVPVLPPEGDIPLLVTFCPPDKRRRDRDNLIASCKAYFDGLADAWGVNDARFEPTFKRGEPVRGGLVHVEVMA